MELWIDAQLPPSLARLFREALHCPARHVEELGQLAASNEQIFQATRIANACVVTKDADFTRLLDRLGPPPQVLWLVVGNLGNAELHDIVKARWNSAAELFAAGEPLVEIRRA
jgi:predicted nuclease of predicted toxin-antitoxin system